MHINPDHFLETPNGRVFTRERNAVAWKQSFAAFDEALRTKTSRSVVYVMVGCQNAGKSTWARARHEQEPDAIIFDAILVKKSEREPILLAAARHQVPAIAVWVQTPLDVCVERNRARPADQIVDEQGMRNVFAALEPPQVSEGFREVIEVPYQPPHVHPDNWSHEAGTCLCVSTTRGQIACRHEGCSSGGTSPPRAGRPAVRC